MSVDVIKHELIDNGVENESLLVLLIVMAVARRVSSNVSLLIVGMMIGSIAGALVNVMQNFANPDSLKLFITWTFGSLSSVGWSEMMIMLPVLAVGVTCSLLLIKNLDGLRLGESYASALGIDVTHTRLCIVLATGLLAGGVTVFCGPIAFVGVAVPHIARGLLHTSSHRLTMPAAMLVGADLLLECDILCSLGTYPLPVSTVSALFGAPIIIHIILKKSYAPPLHALPCLMASPHGIPIELCSYGVLDVSARSFIIPSLGTPCRVFTDSQPTVNAVISVRVSSVCLVLTIATGWSPW